MPWRVPVYGDAEYKSPRRSMCRLGGRLLGRPPFFRLICLTMTEGPQEAAGVWGYSTSRFPNPGSGGAFEAGGDCAMRICVKSALRGVNVEKDLAECPKTQFRARTKRRASSATRRRAATLRAPVSMSQPASFRINRLVCSVSQFPGRPDCTNWQK